jgi:hypothetical protein
MIYFRLRNSTARHDLILKLIFDENSATLWILEDAIGNGNIRILSYQSPGILVTDDLGKRGILGYCYIVLLFAD